MTAPLRCTREVFVQIFSFTHSLQEEFKRRLFDIWFRGYHRKQDNDSSGFEHVFVGETKKSRVIGFHSWLQFYHLEKLHLVDYRGYHNYYPKQVRGHLRKTNFLMVIVEESSLHNFREACEKC